jgi:DNA invertase Pin-like site-specific DNA recombinase
MRVGIYARVSTTNGQTCENQLLELRRYVEVRGWTAKEYVDEGVSGAKDRRPALEPLVLDARRRFDVVVCWSLDRMGRSLKHLVILLDDLQALGVGFISVREGTHPLSRRAATRSASATAIARRANAGPSTQGNAAPLAGSSSWTIRRPGSSTTA